jgi:ketol-acid reductoisomerase
MRYSVSGTAEQDDYMSGLRIVNDETRKEMRNILTKIQSGIITRNRIQENHAGRPYFMAMKRMQRKHRVEQAGMELRKMMKWIDAKEEAKGAVRPFTIYADSGEQHDIHTGGNISNAGSSP